MVSTLTATLTLIGSLAGAANAQAASIEILNHSFEDTQLPFNTFTTGGAGLGAWIGSSGTGVFHISPSEIAGGATNGVMTAYASQGSPIEIISQQLNAVLKANTFYSLLVDIGNPSSTCCRFDQYGVQLLAGGNVLASDDNSLSLAPGTFGTSTIEFTTGATHPGLGENLEIRLFGPTVGEVEFDNVRLGATLLNEEINLTLLADGRIRDVDGVSDGPTLHTTDFLEAYHGVDGFITRTFIEFDISSIPDGSEIGSASLQLTQIGGDLGTTIDIYGYVGDGAVTLSDAPAGSQIDSFEPVLGVNTIDLSTTYIRDRVNAGDTILGLALRSANQDDLNTNFRDSDFSSEAGPMLTLTLAEPEPSTFVITLLPGTIYSADTAAMDAQLGIGGFAIEDFEDTVLIPGLAVSLTEPDSGPLTTLPAIYDPSDQWENNTWDGSHVVINTPQNQNWNIVGRDQIALTITFELNPGVRTLGVGLANFQSSITSHTLFINGVSHGTIESLPNFVSGVNVRNGYLLIEADSGETIDSVAISTEFSGVLGDGLVFDHLAIQPYREPIPDPILHYTFDDGSDPTSNSGTLGASYDGDVQGNTIFAPFNGDQGILLDGSNANSVVIPLGTESAFDIGDGNFSLFARFQTTFFDDSAPRIRGLLWKQATGNNPTYSLGVGQENGLAQFTVADGLGFVSVIGSSPLNDGLTHEVLAVRQGNLLGLLVDGVLDATSTIPPGFGSTNNDEPLVIGGRTLGNTDDWTGLIDEIKVWNEAISELPPSISISRESDGMLRIDFRGILEESVDLESWDPQNPQPVSPFIFTPSGGFMFYRAKN